MPPRPMMVSQRPFVKALARGLRHRCGVRTGARVLVAVSGGADSVALLRGLAALAPCRTWRLQLAVAHVQHHLRPDEHAEADARFVADLARRLKLRFLRADLDPAELGLTRRAGRVSRRGNVEALARRARYDALAAMAATFDARLIATAHHADDQLETLLMRLLRGASVRGLSGMPWRRPIGSFAFDVPRSALVPAEGATVPTLNAKPETRKPILIRPLLDQTHADALAFLRDLKQAWREDHTNQDVTRLRALLRRQVLPVLRQARPDAAQRAAAAAEHFRGLSRVLEEAVARAADHVQRAGDELILDRVTACAWPRVVLAGLLRRLLGQAGVPADRLGGRCLSPMIRAVRDHTGGRRRFSLTAGVQVVVTRQMVAIHARGCREGIGHG